MNNTLITLGCIVLMALGINFTEVQSSEGSNPSEAALLSNVPSKKVELDQQIIQKTINLNHPKREFRAAWVTTFSNLDWPSKRGLTSDEQKEEFINILNQFEKSKINAVIVQVRAAADAFYPSELAPWSAWLSGNQGEAPSPYYDPLAFMIEECHKRNMEFHAWFNPFRAVSHTKFSSVANNHISNTNKEMFFYYGESVYFNPGLQEVQNHIKAVVAEVVNNYDIDGIHFDDYFYPYTINDRDIPDHHTYNKYCTDSTMSIKDWRRNSINQLVKSIGDTIKKIKPYVKFGISPYAVWRNNKEDSLGSKTYSGQTSYDNLYCDTKLWMTKGWVDYMAPQLYWSTKSKYTNYHHLIDWWNNNNINRHLYIGHAIYKLDIKNKHSYETAELVDQINISRTKSTVEGNIFFRADAFMRNHQDFISTFEEGIYKYPALVPQMKWIDSIPPDAPKKLSSKILLKEFVELKWQNPEGSNLSKAVSEMNEVSYFVVYKLKKEPSSTDNLIPENIISIQKTNRLTVLWEDTETPTWYVVTAVDRLHNESESFVYTYIKPKK